jgi:outer membrane protein OmpA-like peptidoglycan-associated protein
MMKRVLVISAILFGVLSCSAYAQEPKTYSDGQRGKVTLPQGDISFADAVIAYDLRGSEPRASASDPAAALGIPTYKGNNFDGSFTTLGCAGQLDLQFIDNALVDVEGPDLYIFEVGPNVEGTLLEISIDGEAWRAVGEIKGGRAEVDISAVSEPGETFRFVRLIDDGVSCDGEFPGADIDAVAAIGSATRYTLDGAVMFETGSSDLRDVAQEALLALSSDIAAAGLKSLTVIGHTDTQGSDGDNMTLSQARAEAVTSYLLTQANMAGMQITARGAGETEPTATNETEEGRAANRRVEIIAKP